MKINRELFKSKKFIVLFSIIITSITLAISKIFGISGDIHLIILPVLSLIFGPLAILGFCIVEFIYLMIVHPNFILINLIVLLPFLISNFAIWKCWYSTMNKYGLETPNITSLYDLIKLFILFFAYTVILWILFFNINKELANYGIIIDYLSTVFSFFGAIFLLYISNYFKIPMYTPQIQFKQIFPKKMYSVFLISFIIVGLYQIFFIEHTSIILIIITTILFAGYFLKPYDKDISEIKQNTEISIFSKVNVSLTLILILITIFIELAEYIIGFRYTDGFSNLEANMLSLIVEISIPILIYLYFLERNVTKPINRLSEIISDDINTKDDYLKHDKKLKTIKVNNEIKILIDSLRNMEHDVIKYGENLVKLTSEKEKYETELKLANDIQNSMIPKDFKEFNDNFSENGEKFELWGIMKAAREVGGDFYDYFQIDEDNVGFVIGDVSGKGTSAALIMVKAMTLIADFTKQYGDLSKVFYEANNILCENNVENHFVTCWLGKINLKTNELSFVNAGHNPPLIKLNNGNFEYIDIQPGLVLAAMEDMSYETHTIQLTKEDTIFLYTDGVTEANDNYKGFYGEDRLKDILNKHKNDDLNIIIKSIEDDVKAFCNYEEQFDDTTMFIIRLK